MKRNFWPHGGDASGCRCAACGRKIGRKIRKSDGPRYCGDCLDAAGALGMTSPKEVRP